MLRGSVIKLLAACAVVLLLAAGAAHSTGHASLNEDLRSQDSRKGQAGATTGLSFASRIGRFTNAASSASAMSAYHIHE